jgi:hypothetical protein
MIATDKFTELHWRFVETFEQFRQAKTDDEKSELLARLQEIVDEAQMALQTELLFVR